MRYRIAVDSTTLRTCFVTVRYPLVVYRTCVIRDTCLHVPYVSLCVSCPRTFALILLVGRQRWHVVQRRRFEAKELWRPGGEAAARGSRVEAEAAVVDSPRLAGSRNRVNEIDIFRINVELELLHPVSAPDATAWARS